MRYRELVVESVGDSYRLFHGSGYDDIEQFRLDKLRHRTGTPGTLSFTTSRDTAKIYGEFVYECEVQGRFGDYLDAADIERVYAWRWPPYEKWLTGQYKPDELEAGIKGAAIKLRKEITDGYYAQWENVLLWREMGWEGAWCHESGSRNLIVGNIDCVRIVGRPPQAAWRTEV